MADDDLDMLQELLELAEDDESHDKANLPETETSQQAPKSNGTGATAPTATARVNQSAVLRPLSRAFQPVTSTSTGGRSDKELAGTANTSSELPQNNSKQQLQGKGGTTEKFSGLRMKNVCFPSIVLKERLADIQFCKLNQVRNRPTSDDNWATIAIVAEKTTKESAKGQAYGIWRLTDLQGTNISFFLFKNAQSGLWKESEGTVVAVFKPQARAEDGKFSLSVDSEQQVVKLGTSMDLGFCGARKKDGTPCRNAVNISTCPYCDYHVQSQYNKIRSQRSELKDSRLHHAFHYANGTRLGASNVPKMTEGGDRVYAKTPTMKKHSEQELQQIAQRASKSIPGAARYLSNVIPGQQASDSGRLQPASKAQAYGPMTRAPVHKHKRPPVRHEDMPNKRPRAHPEGTAGAEGRRAEPETLTLQDDEVDWDSQAQDPALQQALAVIKAKGGLKAPDPNRPFDSRTHLQKAVPKSSPASQQPARQQDRQGDTRSLQPCNTAAAHQSQREQQQSGLHSASNPSCSIPSSSQCGTAETIAAQQRQQQAMVAAGSRAGNSKGGVTAANVAQQQQQQTGATDETSSRVGSSQAAVQVTGVAQQQQQTGATDGTSRRAGSSQAAVQVTSAVQQQEQQQTGATDGTGNRAGSNKAVVRDTTAVQQQQQSVLQGATGSRAGSSMAGVSGRQLAPAGPQDRVLAKLKLGRKPSQTLQASSQPSQAITTAAPSGFAAAFGSISADQPAEHTDTRYKYLVDDEDHDRQMRLLAALEKKDEMQQRMEAITKLNVTAFQCNTCKSTTERRKPECRQHDVQRVTATKRWWVCCHCNNRFHTLAVRLPVQRCPKCNDPGMEFKAASMGRAVKENAEPAYASRGGFKARGTEHAFALNGMV